MLWAVAGVAVTAAVAALGVWAVRKPPAIAASAMESKPAASPKPAVVLPPPAAPLGPPLPAAEHRAVAETVFRHGGLVRLAGSDTAYRKPDELPAGPVVLATAEIGTIPDADWAALFPRLARADTLVELRLEGPPLTDAELAALVSSPAGQAVRTLRVNHGPALTAAGLAHLGRLPRAELVEIRSDALTDAALAAVSRAPALRHLQLYNGRFTAAGLRGLAGRPIERLEFYWCPGMTDAAVGDLAAALPGLKFLWLGHLPVTDAGMPAVARLAALETLRVTNLRLTDLAVPDLAKLTRATEITLVGTRMTPIGVRELQAARPDCRVTVQVELLIDDPLAAPLRPDEHRQLAELALRHQGEVALSGDDTLVTRLADLPATPFAVRRFKIRSVPPRVWPRVFDLIARADTLVVFDVIDSPLTDRELARLVGCPLAAGLTDVAVEHCPRVSPDGLAELGRLPALRTLTVKHPSLTDAAVAGIARAPNLRCAYLFDGPFGAAGAAELAKRPLEFVQIRNAPQFTDKAVKELAASSTISTLFLEGTPLTDAAVADMARMPDLRSLGLYDIPFTDAAADEFAKLTNAKELILINTKVTPAAADAVAARLPACRVTVDGRTIEPREKR